jgi:hypothetical protein
MTETSHVVAAAFMAEKMDRNVARFPQWRKACARARADCRSVEPGLYVDGADAVVVGADGNRSRMSLDRAQFLFRDLAHVVERQFREQSGNMLPDANPMYPA